ncbi:UNVERIFIED_CONTAM: E3 ubiquitin-protein ligase UPL7 [Sesamum radiatum]|uniref:E3 ubiquitin-protein ligase UPL7 n=1 Tax=Sesamum radiatum TaxID=300843 RepID=A0AAW2LAL9_SESRA
MNESRKHQVSLRGASAKEITRDALLERVNQERELRNYTRRANAAALLIQRVWRRHHDAVGGVAAPAGVGSNDE